jgi:hypothetical protein
MSNYEFNGFCAKVLPLRRGTSKTSGQAWASQSYVFSVVDGEHVRQIAVDVFGDDKIQKFNIQVGVNYLVKFDIRSMESKTTQGNFFTSLNAFSVRPCDGNGRPLQSNSQQGYSNPYAPQGDVQMPPQGNAAGFMPQGYPQQVPQQIPPQGYPQQATQPTQPASYPPEPPKNGELSF